MTTSSTDIINVCKELDADEHAEMLSHLGDLEHYSAELDAAFTEHGFPPLGVDSAFYDNSSSAAFEEAQRTRGAYSLSEIMGNLLADIRMLRERIEPLHPDKPENFYDWIGKYQPVLNRFRPCVPLGGFLFETTGEELAFVLEQSLENVWSYIVDGNDEYLMNGLHITNCLGYLVTSNKTDLKEQITVPIM